VEQGQGAGDLSSTYESALNQESLVDVCPPLAVYPFREDASRIQTHPRPVDRSSFAQFVQHTRSNRRHTPAFCQSLRRLQHVTPLPKLQPFGSIPPRDAALEDIDYAGEGRSIVKPQPATIGLG
jgi:hypothetical protein